MIRLSRFQRMEVVDQDGSRVGHVFDLCTSVTAPDRPPVLEGFLVGRGGLARRLGIRRGSARMVPLDEVAEIGPDRIVVREAGRQPD